MEITKENAYGMYCFLVAIYLARADDRICDQEVRYLHSFMRFKGISRDQSEEIIKEIGNVELLKKFLAKLEGHYASQFLNLQSFLNFRQKLEGLSTISHVSLLDGNFSQKERDAIEFLTIAIGLPAKVGKRIILHLEWELDRYSSGLERLKIKGDRSKIKKRKMELIEKHFAKPPFLYCPKCKNKNLVPFEISDVTVDFCQNGCGGMWFDDGELIHLLEIPEDKMLEYHWQYSQAPKEEQHVCPRCSHHSLVEVPFFRLESLMLDRCFECHGFWLDGDELKAMTDLARSYGLGARFGMAIKHISKKS